MGREPPPSGGRPILSVFYCTFLALRLRRPSPDRSVVVLPDRPAVVFYVPHHVRRLRYDRWSCVCVHFPMCSDVLVPEGLLVIRAVLYLCVVSKVTCLNTGVLTQRRRRNCLRDVPAGFGFGRPKTRGFRRAIRCIGAAKCYPAVKTTPTADPMPVTG